MEYLLWVALFGCLILAAEAVILRRALERVRLEARQHVSSCAMTIDVQRDDLKDCRERLRVVEAELQAVKHAVENYRPDDWDGETAKTARKMALWKRLHQMHPPIGNEP